MLNTLAEIRPTERRNVLGAFLTLLGIMVAHSLLETARDALFLSRLDATLLPWAYLAIALVAFLVNSFQERLFRRFDRRRSLALSLALAAGITATFWVRVAHDGPFVVQGLYIWSGVLVTLVVVRFWALVGDVFTVTQAKRLFATIGAGSMLGAILGSGLARLLTATAPAEDLVGYAAGVLLLASLGPFVLRGEDEDGSPTAVDVLDCDTEAGCIQNILKRPYILRLLILMVVSTITFTVVDYVFKAAAGEYVASEDLGRFFATTYLVLNLLSLLVQVGLVGWLVHTLGVQRVLSTPPVMLGLAAAATVVAQIGAPFLLLGSVLALKGVDGSLRHSLHRTTAEMLFVPLSKEVRARAKSFIDVAGQRGGQAVASLLILLIGLFGNSLLVLSILAVVLAVAWLVVTADLRQHYLDLFRDTLQEGRFETAIRHPDLDMASLETLIQTLSSPRDAEVLAALDLLAAQDRTRLIPVLVLYHPSPEIVIKALGLFSRAGREDFLPIAERLMDHADPNVRAATLRAMSAVAPKDFRPLDQFLDDPSPAVRATALVGLVSSDWMEESQAEMALAAFARDAERDESLALGRAIVEQPSRAFAAVLIDLARSPYPEVRLVAAEAMGGVADPSFLPTLVEMVADRRLRMTARNSLLQLGSDAVDYLGETLEDPNTPLDVRRHIPRTLMRFEPDRAAPILLRNLVRDTDGVVRYKILRALGSLKRRYPELKLDRSILDEAIRRTMTGAFQLLDWRIRLVRGAIRNPSRSTNVHELLVSTLEHKEQHTIERLFRLLGLVHSEEDFQKIFDGLQSPRPAVQSSSRELLEALLHNPLREALVSFLDDLPDDARLLAGHAYHQPGSDNYRAVLEEMLASGGMALRALTVYHVGELGLSELEEQLESMERQGFLEGVVTRALSLMHNPRRAAGL